MGKAGQKQKHRPKIKDKKQSERFKETARQLGADKSSDAFDQIVDQMAKDHIARSADLIRKTKDEIRDGEEHVRKSLKAVKRAKRLIKKTPG